MATRIHFPNQKVRQSSVRSVRSSLVRKPTRENTGELKKETATVLVFEPDDTSVKKLCGFLRKKGFRVLSTQRPEGVEFRFKTWPKPDLLVISAHQQADIAMKTFNTFSWNPDLAKCPVFLIGANRQKQFLTKYAKVDHLRKIILTPFKTELFVRVINALIRRSKQSSC